MGTIQHGFAIAVATYNHDEVRDAFARVLDFAETIEDLPFFSDLRQLLVGPVEGVANLTETYFMAPDGSKEGWAASGYGDEVRNYFIQEMSKAGAEVVHGSFGELGTSFLRAER